MQPKAVEDQMRKCYTTTIHYQNRLWTRQTLERLTIKNIGTPEVQSMAANSCKNSYSKTIFRDIVSMNMKIKLDDAIYNEQIAKTHMIKSKMKLKEYVRPSSLAGYEFERLVDKVWKLRWIKNSRDCHDKIPWLLNKQNVLVENLNKNKPSMKFNNVHKEKISKKDEEEINEIISKTRYRDINMEGIKEDKRVINLGLEDVDNDMKTFSLNHQDTPSTGK